MIPLHHKQVKSFGANIKNKVNKSNLPQQPTNIFDCFFHPEPGSPSFLCESGGNNNNPRSNGSMTSFHKNHLMGSQNKGYEKKDGNN